MNKNEFADYLSLKVQLYLAPTGFSYVKSKHAFLKKNKDGWVRISFGFYQFADTNNFNISFEVRINAIEAMVVKYVDINPSDHKNMSTVKFILSTLLGYKYKDGKFEFTTSEALDEIIEKEVVPFLQQKVPFYTGEYSKLENIYKLYTDPEEENYKLIHFGYNTCIRTLIIGNSLFPDGFDNVIKICESRMMALKQKWPGIYDMELFDTHFHKIALSLKGQVFN